MATIGQDNFNDTLPAAPAGYRNAKWQADAAGTNPRNVSAYEPNLGLVDARTTTTETIRDASLGKLVTLSNAGAVAVTLDSANVPAGFMCFVANLGAGAATLTPSTGTIDGAANLALTTNQGVTVFWDGTNWKTVRGISTGGGGGGLNGVNVQIGTYAVVSSDNGKDIIHNSATPHTFTLPNPPPSATWAAFFQNIGAGTLTISRNTLTIDGAASDLTLATGQGVVIFTDGTNYFTERGISFVAGGDLNGTSTSQEVIGILNKAIDGTVPTDGQILQYSSSTGKWEMVVDRPDRFVSGLPGKPTAGQLVGIYPVAFSVTFPANFASPNSYGDAGTNPTATALYQIYKNGTLMGSVSVSTGGVFTFATTGGTSWSANPGDRITLVAPGSQDATLSDVGIVFVGTRTATVPATAGTGIFTFAGAYNGGTAYSVNQIVSYEGGLFVCILPTTGNAPTNATYWKLMIGYVWNFTGAYNGATAYLPNDVATSGGATYLCIAATTGNAPPNATYWSLIAAAGSVSIAQVQQQALVYADDTGTANAYAVALGTAPTLVDGSFVVFKALHTNTGASTLAVNGGSAIAIKKSGGTALTGGEITAGQVIPVVYDGTNFQIVGGGGSSGAPTTSKYVLGATDAALTNAVVNTTIYNSDDDVPASPGSIDDEFDAGSLTGWTWMNQGSATGNLGHSKLSLLAPASASQSLRIIYKAAPSTPWTATLKFTVAGKLAASSSGGLMVSDGTKALFFGLSAQSASGWNVAYVRYATITTYGGVNTVLLIAPPMHEFYVRITDNGTNLLFDYSPNNIDWTNFITESRTAYLSSPARIGIVADSENSSPVFCTCDWFRQS